MKKKVKKTMMAKTVMNEEGNAKVKMNELYLASKKDAGSKV